MDLLTNNPGLRHIGYNILMRLDHETLLSCRSVSQSWRKFTDNPRFWLKKCMKKELTATLHASYMNLIELLEDTDLEHKVTLCLIKLHKEAPKTMQSPIHMASKSGYLELVKFILEQVSPVLTEDQDGNSPIHGAAKYGHNEVVKLLINHTENPIALGHKRKTPIHYAAMCGHLEVIKTLASYTDSPNTKDFDWHTLYWIVLLFATSGQTFLVKLPLFFFKCL